MSTAYVLMTAMPPTKGHERLIRYASKLAQTVVVIVCTQPGEPYTDERVAAIRMAARRIGDNVVVNQLHKELPQEPSVAVDFWDMWAGFLTMYGISKDDIIVASELYGKKLAEITGTRFFPYDIDRELYWSKATEVRNAPRVHFDEILPEFQPYLRKKITLFGAESTGKTTLSKALAKAVGGSWYFEWARPYLETVGTEITQHTMREIWKGQRALQQFAVETSEDKPFIIQDTDLWSTVGYYLLWDGKAPDLIYADALATESDLYLITQSNIPFEKDPIRYGGDKRESDDEFWIDLCLEHGIPHRIIQSDNLKDRVVEAQVIVEEFFDTRAKIAYERVGQ